MSAMFTQFKQLLPGLLFSIILAGIAYFLGTLLPLIGGPVFAILLGMLLAVAFKKRERFDKGIAFTSKKVLQYAVILLGFGMNLGVVLETGLFSLPIILSTISIALLVAFLLHKALRMPGKISTLIGVGSSICGGSAIAATAPVIDADEQEIAQAISVIFFFNILAALIFPTLGSLLGFSTSSPVAFGLFAGTAINDTSSVTAAAATWDAFHGLGTSTLDFAVTVKLTRTLAIIPITLVLAFYQTRKMRTLSKSENEALATNPSEADADGKSAMRKAPTQSISIWKVFPYFILGFIAASAITTIALSFGVSAEIFTPLKTLSKFMIIMAMGAIGLNTDVVKLIKTGGKPLLLGFCCWVSITASSLVMMHVMGIW